MPTDPRYERVLVPTDGSDPASVAVDHAIAVARTHGAAIHAVYVVDARITMAADEATRDELRSQLTTAGREAVDDVRERAGGIEPPPEGVVRHGTPWKEILAYADEAAIDLIVIGTAGASAREKRMRLGSVSERVVDDAPVPVLVVPAGSP